jgi:hypothetical protein
VATKHEYATQVTTLLQKMGWGYSTKLHSSLVQPTTQSTTAHAQEYAARHQPTNPHHPKHHFHATNHHQIATTRAHQLTTHYQHPTTLQPTKYQLKTTIIPPTIPLQH